MLAESTVKSIRKALNEADRILVISHIAPDGDAIGSLLATGLALQQMSKSFTLTCDDAISDRFHYLPLIDQLHRVPEEPANYDLVIALDCGDVDRLGRPYATLPLPRPPLINIDHHITNTQFGQINLVDSEASATAEILFRLLLELGIRLTPQLATCLLTGLVTDTQGFSTANVTAATLRVASALVEAGVNLSAITLQALSLKPLSVLYVWQKGLNNMRLDDGVLWTSISIADQVASGFKDSEKLGLSSFLANTDQVSMSAVLFELADGRVSVSFRCRSPYVVSELARQLGGGGHHLAAGCTVDGPLEKAEQLVIGACKDSMRRQRITLTKNGQSE